MTTAAAITASIGELIVQISRGNCDRARSLAEQVRGDLTLILQSDMDGVANPLHHARQTMFAIDEVLMLIKQSDLRGALGTARDAAKEWRATPKH